MKVSLAALVLVVSLVCAGLVWAADLWPESCGAQDIKFDVKTDEGEAAPAMPTDGKAQRR